MSQTSEMLSWAEVLWRLLGLLTLLGALYAWTV